MSQIEMDHSPQMNIPEDPFEIGEERGRQGFSSLDGPSGDKLHSKGKTIDPFDRFGDTRCPFQPGIYLPFFMDEPEPQGPAKEWISSPYILDHENSTFHFHPAQVRLPKASLDDAG